MKDKSEWNSIGVSIPWSLDSASYCKSTVLDISGHVGFLRAVLPQLITARSIRHPGLHVGNEPLQGMLIGHAISLCGQRLAALGWRLFHADFASHFSNLEPEVMRLAEAVYFLCDDPNRSLTIQQLAIHLGWKPTAVRKWAKQANKLNVIAVKKDNSRLGAGRLKVSMSLAKFSECRDRQLEEEAEDAELAATD